MPGGDITHLNFAFLDFDTSGNLEYTDVDAAHKKNVAEGSGYGTVNAGVLPALQELRAKYPNLRLGLSLGGWSKSGDFVDVASNPTSRANLVRNLAKFVEYNNMDFIDVDWEYPGSVREGDKVDNKNDEGTPKATTGDGKLYIQLLKDLKQMEVALGVKNNRKYELSVALPATSNGLENGAQAYLPGGVTKATATAAQMTTAATTYCTELFSTIDFGNLMTYDMRGAWDSRSGHQAALFSHPSGIPDADIVDFSVDKLVSYLLGKKVDSKNNALPTTLSTGVPSNKIVVGAAFYTRGWEQVANDGVDKAKYPGLFGTTAKVNKDANSEATAGALNADPIVIGEGGRLGGVWPYGRLDDLKAKYSGLTYYYDEIADAPYLYKEGGPFFTYDSPKSIAAKTKYVKDHNLGGVISWMASQDAATGDESSGTWGTERGVLTKAIKAGLFGTASLPKYKIGASGLKVSGAVTIDKNPDNGKAIYRISVKNNFVNAETNMVLNLSAAAGGAVLSPKLYITVKSGVTIPAGAHYASGSWTQTGNVVTVVFTEYSLKTALEPGVCVDVLMSGATETIAVADIEKIEIGKSIYATGHEVARAVIYCAAGSTCSSSSGDGSNSVDYSCGGNYVCSGEGCTTYVPDKDSGDNGDVFVGCVSGGGGGSENNNTGGGGSENNNTGGGGGNNNNTGGGGDNNNNNNNNNDNNNSSKSAKKSNSGAVAAVVVVVVLLVVGAVSAGIVVFVLYKKGIIFNGKNGGSQASSQANSEASSGLYTDPQV